MSLTPTDRLSIEERLCILEKQIQWLKEDLFFCWSGASEMNAAVDADEPSVHTVDAAVEAAVPSVHTMGDDGADFFHLLRKTEGESRQLGVWRGKGTTFRNSRGYRPSLRLLSVHRPTTNLYANSLRNWSGTFDTGISMADFALGGGNDHFKSISDSCRRDGFQGGTVFPSMNKDGQWESFVAELEENAVHVVRGARDQFNWPRRACTEYTLPVVGTMRFRDRARIPAGPTHQTVMYQSAPATTTLPPPPTSAMIRKVCARPSRYFFWRGKFLDTEWVHERVPDEGAAEEDALQCTFRPVHPCATPSCPFAATHQQQQHQSENEKDKDKDDDRAGKKKIRLLRPQKYRSSTKQTLRRSSVELVHDVLQEGDCDAGPFLEIDLGEPMNVTHLGTVGREPEQYWFVRPLRYLCTGEEFEKTVKPFWDEQEKHAAQILGNDIARALASRLRVVPRGTVGRWATAYELSFRPPSSHRWTVLARTTANTDAHTEHIFDLAHYFTTQHGGLYTQYLRLRPLAFNNEDAECTMRVAVYGPDADSRSAAAAAAPVVVYRISHDDGERRVRHGQITGWKKWPPHKQRAARMAEFQQQMTRFRRGDEADDCA